jgi:hypothetical protein
VQVVVPFGLSDTESLWRTVNASLDARKPGLPKQGASHG